MNLMNFKVKCAYHLYQCCWVRGHLRNVVCRHLGIPTAALGQGSGHQAAHVLSQPGSLNRCPQQDRNMFEVRCTLQSQRLADDA